MQYFSKTQITFARCGKRKSINLMKVLQKPDCIPSITVSVRHVTGIDQDYLRKIPRVVVQKSALL